MKLLLSSLLQCRKMCLEKYKEYDFLKDLAATITEAVPETPRGGLEGPGNNSMGKARRYTAHDATSLWLSHMVGHVVLSYAGARWSTLLYTNKDGNG